MDDTSKRAFGGRLGAARKGSSLTLRDTSSYKDQSVQCCNRLGCSTRANSMKSSQIGTSDMTKNSKPSFRTASSKSNIASSSKSYSPKRDIKKSPQEPHKEVSAETSKIQIETQHTKGITSTRFQTGFPEPEYIEPGVLRELSSDESEEIEACRETPNAENGKRIRDKSELRNQDTSRSARRSFASKNINQAAKPSSSAQATGASRYRLRNLGCTSVSDVFPARSSSSQLNRSRKTEVTKRSFDRDSSSRARSSSSSSGESSSGSIFRSTFRSERQSHQQTSRTGNRPSNKDATPSVKTRTATGGNRARIPGHGKGNSRSLAEDAAALLQSNQTDFSVSGSSSPFSSHSPLEDLPSGQRNSFVRPGGDNGRIRLTTHRHRELSINQDGFRRSNVDGIDEVLFALEMIEQDEELSHEQLFFLDSNLFLAGLSFHDQHRDMRLDIDNMSYEELLALEERIGTVSTALTEEALSKCVKKGCYMYETPCVGNKSRGDDDVKCSVCQEEYSEGDELGKLGCDHGYHLECINQWLRQKNWCPICKSPAATS